MSALLLISFLPACALGAFAACRVSLAHAPALLGVILLLSTSVMIGAITAAAEAGSATARYLGLAAVLLTSISLVGTFMAVRRAGLESRKR